MIVVVAPDSFKGSLSAAQACDAMARGLARVWPDADVRARPMADGGEGTLDAILAVSGSGAGRLRLPVHDAGGRVIDAACGLIGDGDAAVGVIEVAEVVGLTGAAPREVAVARRSTRGVGELIRALLDRGVRELRIGLGGSSTNDGGAGLLAALGLRLTGIDGGAVEPTPEGLAGLSRVDAAGLDPRLATTRITVLSDVNNPLAGARGATAIFGPQKGVAPGEIETLDGVLARFATLAESALGRRVADQPGAGAAGGLGFALQLLGAHSASGAAVVADLIGLDQALDGAHWALTGEGRSDAQTLLSKAPIVVAERARRRGVPVTLVSGSVDPAALGALAEHFSGSFGLPPGPADLAACIAHAGDWLADRVAQIAQVRQAAQRSTA